MRIRDDNRIRRSMRRMRGKCIDVDVAIGMQTRIDGNRGVEFARIIQWTTANG